MIITRLMGGLGNQLFQYALGRRLAIDRNVSYKLDLSWFDTQSLRSFRLSELNFSADICSKDELFRFANLGSNRIIRRIHRRVQSYLPYYMRRVVNQKDDGYDPNIMKVPRNSYLIGYWQNERYFAPIVSLLRKEFKLRNELELHYQELEDQIRCDEQSVSLHVRRGDYVRNPHTNSVHGVCPISYYLQAYELISSKITRPTFYIFSDDDDWVQSNLNFITWPFMIVNSNPIDDVQHLHLMASCRHHIIANSSFSWWGSRLGEANESITIAPIKWFTDPQRNFNYQLPDEWIRL